MGDWCCRDEVSWEVVVRWRCRVFFFKQKTAYEMRISDWSSDVCSSDLQVAVVELVLQRAGAGGDDGLQPRQQRRDEVGEGLAGAGAGLGQQHALPVERIGNGDGEVLLRRPRREARDLRRQYAALGQGGAAALRKGSPVPGLQDRKSTRLHSSHYCASRMPSSA